MHRQTQAYTQAHAHEFSLFKRHTLNNDRVELILVSNDVELTKDQVELILVPNDVELTKDQVELILVPNDVELTKDQVELILVPSDVEFPLVFKTNILVKKL